MSRSTTLVVLICVTAIAGGCGQKSAAPPQALSEKQTDPLHQAKTICLAPEKEIISAQKQAQILSSKPESWTHIGRKWIQKARVSFDPGFYFNAQACSEIALNIQQDYIPALELQALVLMNNHKFKEAQLQADSILKKTPDNLIALGVKADALLELGEFETSSETIQQMMDIRPDMASFSRASYARWLQSDVKAAKVFIQQALEGRDVRDPEPAAWTFVQAGILFWNEGDYEGADALFVEALRWVPNYPQAMMNRGRVALSLQHPERAIEFLEKAFELYPLAETAWLLGDARAMSDDLTGAEREYQRVIDEGRKSDPLTLAYFYAVKNRNLDEAARLIDKERMVRNNIYVEDTYAWVQYRLGKYKEAQESIDRALRLGTRDARLWYHAGAIQLASGQTNGHNLINKALKLNPEFDVTSVMEAKQDFYAKAIR